MNAADSKVRVNRTGPTDAAIVALVAQGDTEALGLLYDRYAEGLLRLAGRLVGTQDARDIVHSAFLRVVSLAPLYDEAYPNARPWLYGIVLRMIQEHRRSAHRWASMLMNLASQPKRTPMSISETRPDLDACVARLSLPKRTVLLLSEVEGFTAEEIAAMLSVPVGTVWTRLHHARRELRQLYGGNDDS
jgi:RNA polymerase sigma-70 factor (ECF subfamily)